MLVSKPPDPAVAADVTAYAESLEHAGAAGSARRGAGRPHDGRRRARSRPSVATWAEPWSWDDQPAPSAGGRAARAVRRRHPVRRGDGHRLRRARRGPVQHPAAARSGRSAPDLRADRPPMLDLGDDALTQGRAAPDDRPAAAGSTGSPSRRPTRRARCCCSTWSSVTARTPTRPPSWPRRSPPAVSTAADAGRELAVVVSLCATRRRPAGPAPAGRAAARGRRRGVPVQRRPRARHAVALAGGHAMSLLDGEPRVVAVGAQLFSDALGRRRCPVDPGRLAPAAGRRGHEDAPGPRHRRPAARRGQRHRGRPAAHAPAPSWSTYVLRRRRSACSPAQFLHAGPPIGWDRASGPLRGALIGAMLYEGLADDTPRRPRRRSPPAPASRWTRATTTAPSARWPAWSARRCGCSSCATRCTAAPRGAR